ncbi:MAG: hypothetical protein IKQ43_05575 [Treponema sp.]|nr:hypothetical protein [Treponema sp.]
MSAEKAVEKITSIIETGIKALERINTVDTDFVADVFRETRKYIDALFVALDGQNVEVEL